MDMSRISASRDLCLFSSENHGESSVSRALCLYDEPLSWEDNKVACGPKDKNIPEEKKSLAHMRYLTNEEIKEEEKYNELFNVSTQLTLFTDPWTFKNKLTKVSIGPGSYLPLNGKLVESHILNHLHGDFQMMVQLQDGLTFNVYDHDTHSMHQAVLRLCTRNQIYVLFEGWAVEFVRRRALKRNDKVGMFWDRFKSMLHFRVFSRAPNEEAPSAIAIQDPALYTPLLAEW